MSQLSETGEVQRERGGVSQGRLERELVQGKTVKTKRNKRTSPTCHLSRFLHAPSAGCLTLLACTREDSYADGGRWDETKEE